MALLCKGLAPPRASLQSSFQSGLASENLYRFAVKPDLGFTPELNEYVRLTKAPCESPGCSGARPAALGPALPRDLRAPSQSQQSRWWQLGGGG